METLTPKYAEYLYSIQPEPSGESDASCLPPIFEPRDFNDSDTLLEYKTALRVFVRSYRRQHGHCGLGFTACSVQ